MKTIVSTLLLASALGFTAAAEGKMPPGIELKVKPEREVLQEGGTRQTVLQVEIVAKPSDKKRSTPLNLALVLDKSGSMAGAKLEKARQAAAVAVDQLEAEDFFSLVAYDDDVEVLVPPQKVKDKEAIKAKIFAIRDGGGTALYAGVEKGAAQIRKYLDEEKINRIILLSDGQANVGLSSTSDLAKLGKELRGEGLSVSTVGLGEDYNEDLMTALAEASHANYYYVQDAEKLPGIFSQELGTVKSVAGRDVKILITLPDGVKPLEVLGEEGIVFQGQSVTIPLAEFFGSQTRRFLISCEAPDVKAEQIEMAKVELSYFDVGYNTPVRREEIATVRQSRDVKESEASIQSEVIANRAVTENRLAKEKAIKLSEAGKPKEAAETLQRQVAANAALPAAAQSAVIAQEQKTLGSRINELRTRGSLSQVTGKTMKYENYQDKNSKR